MKLNLFDIFFDKKGKMHKKLISPEEKRLSPNPN
jgi:hypothetical protein